MQIDKDTVLDFLRSTGADDKVADAKRDLPGKVDTDKDKNLLERFGIDVGDLVKMVSGGKLGELTGGLGKLLGR